MTIYLIRHGESKANELNLFLGHGDLDLTDRGYAQARKTAQYLITLKVDAIYSSDLLRAYHTAKESSKLLNLPVIKDARLREIDCGEWDFMPFDELKVKFKDTFDVWLTDVGNAKCDGGESVKQVQERIVNALTDIANKNQEKTVLVFSHATAIRCFAGFCTGKGAHGVKDIPWANNASVTKIEYLDGKFNLIEYGKDDFMGDIGTGLPNNV